MGTNKSLDMSLSDLWQRLLKEDPDRPLLKVSDSKDKRTLNYTPTSFYKRAARIAVVFQRVLGIEAGSRILLALEDRNEIALIFHGALLAGLVVVPADFEAPLEELKKIIKLTNPEAVFFPASGTAKLVSLAVSAPSVRHWIAPGRNEAPASVAGGLKRLENLLLSVAGEEYQPKDVKLGGLEFLNGLDQLPNFINISQLLNKANDAASVLAKAVKAGTLWTSFPALTVASLIHDYLLVLFLPVPVLVREYDGAASFWAQMLADDITTAIISAEELAEILKKGKSRGWRQGENFQVVVCDDVRLDQSLIKESIEKFHLSLGTAFFSKEHGIYLSIWPPEDKDMITAKDESERLLASYGVVEPEVSIIPDPLFGQKFLDNKSGALTWGRIQYIGSSGVPVELNLRAAISERSLIAGKGAGHLFVAGLRDDVIVRRSRVLIMPCIINLVKQLTGVSDVRAIVTESLVAGQADSTTEYFLYVYQNRLADINKYDVEIHLAEQLPAEELPYSIVIAPKGESRDAISDNELLLKVFK